MATASRASLILVGLLVASFCVNAANAWRVVPAETNKLAVDLPGTVDKLTKLLTGTLGPITINLVVDLRKLPAGDVVVLEVLDVVDGAAVLELVGGVLETVQPLKVRLSVADTLKLVVELAGVKKNAALPLDALNPVLAAVGNAVTVVLALVPAVLKGVDVVNIVNDVGDIVATIVRGL